MLMRERLGVGGLKHPGYNDAGSALSIGGSVASGLLGSNAADDAADAIANANGLTQEMINNQSKANNRAFNQYTNSGGQASAKLSYLLGLGPQNYNQYSGINLVNSNPDGSISPNSLLYSSDPAYKSAFDKLRKRIETNEGFASNASKIDGYADTFLRNTLGSTGAGSADTGGDYGSLLNKFTQNDLNNDVVYNTGLQFGLDQGNQAISRLASSAGGLDSGATLKALARYANDYGTTKAEGAYNRFNLDKSNLYNMLSGQQGVGLSAAANNAGLNNNLTTAGANANMNAAIQQGNMGMAGASAVNNAIQGGIGNYLYNQRTQNAPVFGTGYGYTGGSSSNPVMQWWK